MTLWTQNCHFLYLTATMRSNMWNQSGRMYNYGTPVARYGYTSAVHTLSDWSVKSCAHHTRMDGGSAGPETPYLTLWPDCDGSKGEGVGLCPRPLTPNFLWIKKEKKYAIVLSLSPKLRSNARGSMSGAPHSGIWGWGGLNNIRLHFV